ncbi:MAG TPA: hydroxymethylglutaryl-CoA lyase [Sediminibacterium sp.]|nr:hydroxymethylglutaryl-CoA lyase [Sediminibacterium sp.]
MCTTAPDIKLVECPRDAMQGWKNFIPTEVKINYLNQLLQVGFDVLDCGSFVSPKAIPQMADTAAVIRGLRLNGTRTSLLVIVANTRGAEEAVAFDEIRALGFPFSLSPTFQQRNTNSTMEESLHRVESIQEICVKNSKELVIYLSMGFGNPYGDAYNEDLLLNWAGKMADMGIGTISLADTVGLATSEQISRAVATLVAQYQQLETGVHLHSTSLNWYSKLDAAWQAGCIRYDGALKGIGGCPMAQDDLVGNMDTELMIPYFQEKGFLQKLNKEALTESARLALDIFH